MRLTLNFFAGNSLVSYAGVGSQVPVGGQDNGRAVLKLAGPARLLDWGL